MGEDHFLLYLVTYVTFAIRKLKQGIPVLFRVCGRERSAQAHSGSACAAGEGCQPVVAIITAEGYLW